MNIFPSHRVSLLHVVFFQNELHEAKQMLEKEKIRANKATIKLDGKDDEILQLIEKLEKCNVSNTVIGVVHQNHACRKIYILTISVSLFGITIGRRRLKPTPNAWRGRSPILSQKRVPRTPP